MWPTFPHSSSLPSPPARETLPWPPWREAWSSVGGLLTLEGSRNPQRESRMSKPVLDFIIKWNSVTFLRCWSHPGTVRVTEPSCLSRLQRALVLRTSRWPWAASLLEQRVILDAISLNYVPGAIRGKSKGASLSPQQPKMVMMFPTVFHLPVLLSTPGGGQPFRLSHIPPPKVRSQSVKRPWEPPLFGALFASFQPVSIHSFWGIWREMNTEKGGENGEVWHNFWHLELKKWGDGKV